MTIWPITWPASANIAAADPNIKLLAELYAGACMRFLTLQRAGGEPVTIIPGSHQRVSGWFGHGYSYGRRDWYLAGAFYPIYSEDVYPAAYDLQRWTDTFRTEAIELPGPVGAVTEVTVDGAVLDPAGYRIEDGRWLVRLGGLDWPHDLTGGFSITYLNATPVSAMGAHAGGVLAAEWLKLIGGEKKCRLPSSVTNVIRQGMTYEVTRGMFPEGKTGLPEVDAYLMLFNPFGLSVAPRVYSLDLPAPRQVTW